MEGCTNGAIERVQLGRLVLGEDEDRLAASLDQLGSDPPRVAQVIRQALPGRRLHRLDADVGTSAAVAGSLLDALRSEGERTVVHVPEGERKRREALEVVVAEHLLPVDVHRTAQLGELGQRTYVVEHHTPVVRGSAGTDVGEQGGFPVAVFRLLRPVPESVTGPVPRTGGRESTVAHQATEDRLPLEVGQGVGHRLKHAVADRELLGFTPTARCTNQVVRCGGEL